MAKPDPAGKKLAARTMSTTEHENALELHRLLKKLESVDEDDRFDALEELTNMAPSSEAIPQIVKAMSDEHELVVVQALEAAEVQGCPEYYSSVVACLEHESVLVRRYAAIALSAVPGAGSINLLEERLLRYPAYEQLETYIALHRFGRDEVFENILSFLESEDYHYRCSAANLLEYYYSDERKREISKAFRRALKKEKMVAPRESIKDAIAEFDL